MSKIALKLYVTAIALFAASLSAAAHEVWIEQDGKSPARIYLGEPDNEQPEGGDPEFHRLVAPKVFHTDAASSFKTARKADHLQVLGNITGDLRLIDNAIFDPWESDGKQVGAVFYARGGRSETNAYLPLEIVPTKAGSNIFTVQFEGKSLPEADVVVIAPGRKKITLKADSNGQVKVDAVEAGRYIVSSLFTQDKSDKVAGKPVDAVMHITTTTFWQR